tara:strand:- start:131 stop:424 length:294 start_codon:yes stop_codon:yes gene_type:complete
MNTEITKKITFDLNSTICGPEDVKIGLPVSQSQRFKIVSQDLKISYMKPKSTAASEDSAINVMDYFQNAPETIVSGDELSFADKIKQLLICNQTAKK